MPRLSIFVVIAALTSAMFAQAPTPIVVTDANGNQLTITGATTGVHVGGPLPAVLTDVNGNALNLGSSSGGGIVSTGLIGKYTFNEGAGPTLVDSSGAGNNATACGATPTWNSVVNGGGVTFAAASSQCINLPAAINAAKTIQIFMNYQATNLGTATSTFMAPIFGSGANANSAGILFVEGSQGTSFPTGTAGYLQNHISTYGAGGIAQSSLDIMFGTGMVTVVQDAALDSIYINNYGPLPCSNASCAGHTGGAMTTGNYVLGGRAAGTLNSNSSFFTGIMYYALFYNVELTAAQVAQNYYAVSTALQARGIPLQSQNVTINSGLPTGLGMNQTGNWIVSTGDSIDFTNGGYFQFMAPATINGQGWQGVAMSHSGDIAPGAVGKQEPLASCMWVAPFGYSVDHLWWGQNGLGAAAFGSNLLATARQLKLCGHTILVGTNIANSNNAGKNTNNLFTRTNWTQFAQGLADVAESPSLGADGAAANATFFPDGLHLSLAGHAIAGPIWQRTFNHYMVGGQDFTTGSTYTTTAPAATTITAASESTNTVTFTFTATPATFVIGSDLHITGVTPAGYNTTSADTICHVITRTATQVTCFNATTGLGAGSVFGTAQVATQLDTDNYVTLAGSATSPVFALNTCQGLTGLKIYIKNSNTTSPWVLESEGQLSGAYAATETIDSANTLTMPAASSSNNPVVVLQAVLNGPTTGGCTWKRLQ